MPSHTVWPRNTSCTGTDLTCLESQPCNCDITSHAEAPWSATKDGKVIDYELAHYRHPLGAEPLDQALAKSSKFAKYVAALR